MSLLKPVEKSSAEITDLVVCNEVLRENGLTKLAAGENECAQVLDEIGYTLKDTLQDLAQLAKYCDSDKIRLGAIKTALQVRGKLNLEREHDGGKSITFVVQGNAQLNSILNPQRG